MPRHFLTLNDRSPEELDRLLDRALELKRLQQRGERFEPFRHRVLAMLFEKPSTRTRVSFEVGMVQLGGHALFLSPRDTQLGRGEPIADSARVLSSMVDLIMVRTFAHATLGTFAAHASVPVINGLSDDFHPCQLLADIMTFREHRGPIAGKTVAWVGDGNNMCQSYINAASRFDFQLRIATPPECAPDASLTRDNPAVTPCDTPEAAVDGAHLVVTDVWASMGQEAEKAGYRDRFSGYQVSPALMDHADPEALFMHCLPAHRGEEVSDTMLDDPRSVVWDEAENRLHSQKALMEQLLNEHLGLA